MTEPDFLDRIDRAADWRPIALALADWLEERGDPRAAGFRWLVEKKKTPAPSSMASDPRYFWFPSDAVKQTKTRHGLPTEFGALMKKDFSDLLFVHYPALSAALADAAGGKS